jgi:putative membrane protein
MLWVVPRFRTFQGYEELRMQNAFMNLFPEADREKIAAAVREAENVTSGEIVPYVVGQSDHYESAEWRGGVLGGLLAFLAVTLLRGAGADWTVIDPVGAAAATLLSGGVAMLAVRFLPPLKRLFAGRHLMTRRVEQRAAEAFIGEEVFATEKRTGILIFLSLLERRVLVIGDSGIHARVRQDEWHEIIDLVVKAIQRGKPADGLVEAIRRSGALLAGHGVSRGARDRDELSDDLRIRNE